VAGFEKVRGLLSRGRAGVVIQASDGAAGGRDKLRALARDVPVIGCFTGAELGAVFGRDFAVHAAIARDALAGRLIVEAGRLAGFRRLGDGTSVG
jgi:ribosomal protein L7Ae-like RNA K-turn-binding protein